MITSGKSQDSTVRDRSPAPAEWSYPIDRGYDPLSIGCARIVAKFAFWVPQMRSLKDIPSSDNLQLSAEDSKPAREQPVVCLEKVQCRSSLSMPEQMVQPAAVCCQSPQQPAAHRLLEQPWTPHRLQHRVLMARSVLQPGPQNHAQ